jgi:hypothetical protein
MQISITLKLSLKQVQHAVLTYIDQYADTVSLPSPESLTADGIESACNAIFREYGLRFIDQPIDHLIPQYIHLIKVRVAELEDLL